MEYYNLYYRSKLVNTKPLPPQDVVKVKNEEFIFKKNKFNGELMKIPTNELQVVKTYII